MIGFKAQVNAGLSAYVAQHRLVGLVGGADPFIDGGAHG